MHSPRKSGLAGANDPLAVGYFMHFRKDLTEPYGQAFKESAFGDDHMNKVLRTQNCEFFKRPDVAMSMLSDTVISNLPYVENTEVSECVGTMLDSIKELLPYFQLLSNKHESTMRDADEAVKKVAKYLYHEDAFLDNYLLQGLEYSSAMFLMLAWIRAGRWVFQHPNETHQKIHHGFKGENFKRSAKRKNYIKDLCGMFSSLSIGGNNDNSRSGFVRASLKSLIQTGVKRRLHP